MLDYFLIIARLLLMLTPRYDSFELETLPYTSCLIFSISSSNLSKEFKIEDNQFHRSILIQYQSRYFVKHLLLFLFGFGSINTVFFTFS